MTKTHAKSLAAAPDGAITLEILLPEAGAAPKRVQLLPPGVEVVGRDGARWTKADPQRIAAASAQAAQFQSAPPRGGRPHPLYRRWERVL